jgi:hypothetical protein
MQQSASFDLAIQPLQSRLEYHSRSWAINKRWHTGFRRFFVRFLRIRFRRFLTVRLQGTADHRQDDQQYTQALRLDYEIP